MEGLLSHPAVQGGLVPFVVALIVVVLFQRLSGLAIIAGFAVTVYLVSGFSFEPLTAARKIVLLGSLSALLSLPLMWFNPRGVRVVLALVGSAAAVWVALRILNQQEMTPMLLWSAGCALYVGWLTFWMDGLHVTPVRAASAGLGLGIGTGGAALFGASALFGQYGMALGAASGAYLLIQMVSSKSLSCGRTFTLPLSLIAGLTGCLAVLTAQLPWHVLPVLAVIPLAAQVPLPTKHGLWLQSVLLSIVTLSCAVGAVYLTWRVTGAPPL